MQDLSSRTVEKLVWLFGSKLSRLRLIYRHHLVSFKTSERDPHGAGEQRSALLGKRGLAGPDVSYKRLYEPISPLRVFFGVTFGGGESRRAARRTDGS